MASTQTCIELARGCKGWRTSDKDRRAAMAILEDCCDRRGIKSEFRQCDDDVIDDIIDSWAAIIRETRESAK